MANNTTAAPPTSRRAATTNGKQRRHKNQRRGQSQKPQGCGRGRAGREQGASRKQARNLLPLLEPRPELRSLLEWVGMVGGGHGASISEHIFALKLN